jgi:hypothetical protein
LFYILALGIVSKKEMVLLMWADARAWPSETQKRSIMTLTEIFPTARQLPTVDKIRLLRILAEDLDTERNLFPFEPYKIYFLATPYNKFGAGNVLMEAAEMSDAGNN